MVALGHAIDNGKLGRDYAICIDGANNSSNKSLQSFSSAGVQLEENSGNNLVTSDNTPTKLQEQSVELGKQFCSSHDVLSSGVNKESFKTQSNPSKGSNGSLGEVLPTVTTTVTKPNAASSREKHRICYPVTKTQLQVGDRVILTGEGNCRSSDELKAIWTVKTLQGQKTVIHCEALGDRVVPREWLGLYEQAAKSS